MPKVIPRNLLSGEEQLSNNFKKEMKVTDMALEYVATMKTKFPDLTEKIQEFYDLFVDEVESGESPNNEYELMCSSIDELIQEKYG